MLIVSEANLLCFRLRTISNMTRGANTSCECPSCSMASIKPLSVSSRLSGRSSQASKRERPVDIEGSVGKQGDHVCNASHRAGSPAWHPQLLLLLLDGHAINRSHLQAQLILLHVGSTAAAGSRKESPPRKRPDRKIALLEPWLR